MTKSQVNKLGDKLRAAGMPEDQTLTRLQEFRATYDAPMAKAQLLLEQKLHVQTTARLKTLNTIIEKLRREKTRLAEMQDIAGLRIVEEMGLTRQDELAGRILDLFPGAKVVDRRQKPMYGYRALHIIAVVDGSPVEIQVRTRMQDLWAQAMEKLADERGRGIRYGQVPDAAAKGVGALMLIADIVASGERALDDLQKVESQFAPPHRAESAAGEQRRRIEMLKAEVHRLSESMRGILNTFAGLADVE